MTDNQDDVDRLASARLIELAISGIGPGFYKEIAFKPHQWQQIIAALRRGHELLDELFSTKTAPTPCPTCGGLRERHLERRLALAQTEIKGHMRVEDELKVRIAELEEALAGVLEDITRPDEKWSAGSSVSIARCALKGSS